MLEKPVNFTRVIEGTTELKGGISGATLNPDYIVDTDLKKLIKLSVPTSGTIWTTEYDYSVENIIQVEDANSISIYGEKDYMETNPNLEERADVFAYANQLLSRYSLPFWTGNLETTDMTLTPGVLITVVDAVNDINTTFAVKEVKILGLRRGIQLVVGNEEYRMVDYLNELDNRINKLEEKFKGETELMQQVKSFVDYMDISMDEHIKVQYRSGCSLSGIWDKFDIYGTWDAGSSIYDNDRRTALITIYDNT
jgi:hypothetical protein